MDGVPGFGRYSKKIKVIKTCKSQKSVESHDRLADVVNIHILYRQRRGGFSFGHFSSLNMDSEIFVNLLIIVFLEAYIFLIIR